MCCGGRDGECRPLGFLLGLPFAFLACLISLVGIIIWIVGVEKFLYAGGWVYQVTPARHNQTVKYTLLLTCICPCCLCVTVIVELALELVKAPIHVMEWFTAQIPC